MKKLTLIIILLIFSLLVFSASLPALETRKIKIRDQIFTVELAVKYPDKSIGLAHREHMGTNRGMLFIYDTKSRHSFWMKGMRFPLDFLWIDGHEIIEITEDVPVPMDAYPISFNPVSPVDKVLELNAGTVDKYGLSTGDVIEFIDAGTNRP